MIPPEELISFLRNEDNFIIATHVNPDGDGIGSASALSMALRALGKKTVLLSKDPVPKTCRFLPGSDGFFTYDNIHTSGGGAFSNLIIIDCNHPGRISTEKIQLSSFNFRHTVVIDHHETESDFGDIRWVVRESPASAMMVLVLIKCMGVKITADMASNLYAGLIVDTGNFRHENTNAAALRAAAELVECGAVPVRLYRELFDSWSDGRFKLFVKTMGTLYIEAGVSIVTVTGKMFEETGTSADDTENFVEFPIIAVGIKVSILLRETGDGGCKVSLRSKGEINVARVAAEFGGGGHKNAAGCTINTDLKTAGKKLLNTINSL
jgi:phosphoesterase RecJ-like protein